MVDKFGEFDYFVYIYKMIGIYKIINPKGKIYVGQSVNIKKRFAAYKSKGSKLQVKLFNSFTKYGVENHRFEILEECEESKLNERERYYQNLYKVLGKNGLNLRLTKSSDKSGLMSLETRVKMSKAQLQAFPLERRLLCAERAKGNKNMKGKVHSKQSRVRMSIKKNLVKRKVVQLTLDNQIVEIFDSTKAVELKGFINSNVVQCCKGTRPTHHGFKWKYYGSK